ncbi:MAG TPA: carbon storage regulator [bacterium]|nr:carbon storage regulator [bacterium]
MLVLTRNEGQSILIGDDIEITILKSGSSIRIGIDAPPDIPVDRSEIRALIELDETAD